MNVTRVEHYSRECELLSNMFHERSALHDRLMSCLAEWQTSDKGPQALAAFAQAEEIKVQLDDFDLEIGAQEKRAELVKESLVAFATLSPEKKMEAYRAEVLRLEVEACAELLQDLRTATDPDMRLALAHLISKAADSARGGAHE